MVPYLWSVYYGPWEWPYVSGFTHVAQNKLCSWVHNDWFLFPDVYIPETIWTPCFTVTNDTDLVIIIKNLICSTFTRHNADILTGKPNENIKPLLLPCTVIKLPLVNPKYRQGKCSLLNYSTLLYTVCKLTRVSMWRTVLYFRNRWRTWKCQYSLIKSHTCECSWT